MKIIETENFKIRLKQIAIFIKQHNKQASIKFVKELKQQINDLIFMPKKYRKSIYFDNENIRDIIFKGYTIVYFIDNNTIKILDIFNQNLPHKDN